MATIRKALKIEDKYPRTNTVVDRFIKPTLEELSKITKYNLDYKVVKGTIRFSYKLNIVEV